MDDDLTICGMCKQERFCELSITVRTSAGDMPLGETEMDICEACARTLVKELAERPNTSATICYGDDDDE